jgi:hypothetical protein
MNQAANKDSLLLGSLIDPEDEGDASSKCRLHSSGVRGFISYKTEISTVAALRNSNPI